MDLDLATPLKRPGPKRDRVRSHTVSTPEQTDKEKKLQAAIKPSTTERQIKRVLPPIAHRLTLEEVFALPNKMPDCERLKNHFKREGRIECEAAKAILQRAKELFMNEPNLLELQPPVTVCGDIHGQYFDLLNVLEKVGDPKTTPYLFLGDYVDRGCFSTDVCLLLFAYKISNPATFCMLRGNHECRLMTSYFNFKLECCKKYSQEVYDEFMDLFDCLPLAATVACDLGTILCMHGGLSPEVDSLEDIRVVDRFMEPPKTGALCDLIWSDPIEEDTAEGLTEEEMEEWYEVQFVENPTRGCGFIFGYAAVMQFIEQNNLLMIVRAHEVQAEGYHNHHFLRNDREHPPCITVFSAPNYCDMYNNKAAMMCITKEGYAFKQVGWTDHPFYLPDMMDGLNWSFPFVIENLTEISLAILKIAQGLGGDDEEGEAEEKAKAKEGGEGEASEEGAKSFHNRLMSVRNMLRLANGITKEREQLLNLKKFAEVGAGQDAWKKIKEYDRENEQLPRGGLDATDKKQKRRRTKTI